MEATLPENLAYIADKDAEIVLVDWCSEDGLREWVLENFWDQLELGKLRLFSLQEDRPFSIPIGKNFAHRLAKGTILFNLDADNFAHGTYEHASRLGTNEIQGCNTYNKGIYGRIAIRREGFSKLGGYDEQFHPAGAQDRDLIARAKASGMTLSNYPAKRMAIANSKFDTINSMNCGLSWQSMNDQNCRVSARNIAEGRLRANESGCTIATFFDHLGVVHRLGKNLFQEGGTHPDVNQDGVQFIAIITYGRTGSTALQFAINRQEGVVVRGENHNAFKSLFTFHQALRKGKAQGGAYARHPWFGATLWNEGNILNQTSTIAINEILRPETGTKFLGFKEIRHTPKDFKSIEELSEYLLFLTQLFPGLRILLNRRNPETTIRSGWWPATQDAKELLTTCHDWFGRLAGILEARANYPVATLVEFETWSTAPESLQAAWEFLGLPWCEEDVRQSLSIRLKH